MTNPDTLDKALVLTVDFSKPDDLSDECPFNYDTIYCQAAPNGDVRSCPAYDADGGHTVPPNCPLMRYKTITVTRRES